MAKVTVILDGRLRLSADELGPGAVRALKHAFTHENAKHAVMERMGLPTWKEPREIATWTEYARGDVFWISVPRGGAGRVRAILKEHGHTARMVDRRVTGERHAFPAYRGTLWPHQQQLVDAVVAKEQFIAVVGTGGGKTNALIAAATHLATSTLVIVPSEELRKQWVRRLVSLLGVRERDVGVIQGKTRRLRPITIALAQTMAKAASNEHEVREFFGAVFFDEVHLCAARTFFAAVDPMPARWRVGASADHRRKDKKEFLIHDLFGEVGIDVPMSELAEKGFVLNVEILVVPTNFEAEWYGIASEEHPTDEKELNFGRLLKEMAADEHRNRAIVAAVQEESSRGPVIVMAHERDHCMAIGHRLVAAGVPTGYMIGGADFAAEFASSLEGLTSGRLKAVVGTYKALGTGIDLPMVGSVVAATPIAGNEQFFGQVRGRACRTKAGKRGARLVYIWDRRVYPGHLANLARWNERTFVADGANGWIDADQYRSGIDRRRRANR